MNNFRHPHIKIKIQVNHPKTVQIQEKPQIGEIYTEVNLSVILSVDSINTSKFGTLLDVWYVGGEHAYVKRPFDPYFYSLIKLPKWPCEEKQLTDLATFKKIKVFKVSFPDTTLLTKNRDSSFTMDDDIPYVQRVAIDEGFYFKSHLPRHYAFDIETWKGHITAVSFYGQKEKDVSVGDNEKEHIEFLSNFPSNSATRQLKNGESIFLPGKKIVFRFRTAELPSFKELPDKAENEKEGKNRENELSGSGTRQLTENDLKEGY